MGLQKYRADEKKERANGAIEWSARWMGGPSLSKVEKCPTMFGLRMVYVTGDANTWFSYPAACKVGGKTVRGTLMWEEEGPYFWAYLPNSIPSLSKEN